MNRQAILPRRLVGSAILAVTVSTLGACASTGAGGGGGGYSQEMAELDRSCTARGGILTPIPGANTGNPGTDYACTIRGGATRLEP